MTESLFGERPRSLEIDEAVWDTALDTLLPDVHEVDRAATRVWFAFWPLALARRLGSHGAEEAVRRFRLDGRFRLDEQLEESVAFLHGSRDWPAIKQAALERREALARPDPAGLDGAVRDAATSVAAARRVSDSEVLGIAAVAFMALHQVGAQAFSKDGRMPEPDRRSASARLRARARRGRVGPRRWLAPRTHTVAWSEAGDRARFRAVQGQNLTMAAAASGGDHGERDPRCLEGPIPVQCRAGECGYCWIGVLHGADGLSPMDPFERRRLADFGYRAPGPGDESHPPIRLACQCTVRGSATLALPPWNGVLGGKR